MSDTLSRKAGLVCDPRVRAELSPVRILWKQEGGGARIADADILLKAGNGQAVLAELPVCELRSAPGRTAALLLDFGREIHGGVRIVSAVAEGKIPWRVRLRFGESVSEAMSDAWAAEATATNDHALRDYETHIPWLGALETGNTGFRFLRIDYLDTDRPLRLKEISGVLVFRDVPYIGSFHSSDDRLNRIWDTGAYTLHLNMQTYLWDGIKRDRLVWAGDMHPELMTLSSVFGYNEVVPQSLDLSRDTTPLPGWMNGIGAYSLWWILIHRDYFRFRGDLAYLRAQSAYLRGLLSQICAHIDDTGHEHLGGMRFLDWPSKEDTAGVDAGLHALSVMALEAGAHLCEAIAETATASLCREKAARMRRVRLDPGACKQAAALMAIAGLLNPDEANRIVTQGGARGFSTFYGYYMLQAQALSGDYLGALGNIRRFWGGMLDLGATTFWEDFDLAWLENAGRIDELTPEGKVDIHAAYGGYCYKGLRHSLCHGWASGPTAWLSEHVLGIRPLSHDTFKIEPHLGDLDWAEGTFPTAKGVLRVSHRKGPDGKPVSDISAPEGLRIV